MINFQKSLNACLRESMIQNILFDEDFEFLTNHTSPDEFDPQDIYNDRDYLTLDFDVTSLFNVDELVDRFSDDLKTELKSYYIPEFSEEEMNCLINGNFTDDQLAYRFIAFHLLNRDSFSNIRELKMSIKKLPYLDLHEFTNEDLKIILQHCKHYTDKIISYRNGTE